MSYLIRLCLILIFGVYCEAEKPSEKEAFMTTSSIIRAAGYPVQTHLVTTSDGYILIQHRIPGGRLSANQTGELNAKRKKAILILHGFGGCSSNFVLLGPKRSLGYFLADAGYDVWLANLRGTLHSAHVNLTKTDKKFWNFTFHEHGEYDVPAVIEHILNVTGLEKIMILGHSLGTTNFFATLALRPEYNDKLIAFVGLAPSMFLDHLKDILDLTFNTLQLTNAAKGIGWEAIMPNIIHALQENLCNKNRPTIDLCTILIQALFGVNSEQHDVEMAPVYLWRIQPFPFGPLEHFGKIALTGVFTKFTGGLHGPVEPYNTSNIRIPVSLLYGENDRLSDKAEMVRLREELTRYTVIEEIEPRTWRKFNHIDFIFAKDVATLLNRPLVKHIDKLYNKYGPV